MAPRPHRRGQEPQVIVTDEMIERRDWTRKQKPAYKVSVVAQLFFAMSPSWLRLHLSKKDVFTEPDGSPMNFRRLDPGKGDSARVFWLSDVERMARRLYALDKIEGPRYTAVLRVITAQAELYELFDDPDDPAERQPEHAGAAG